MFSSSFHAGNDTLSSMWTLCFPAVSFPPNAPTRTARLRAWLATPSGLAAVFVAGFAIRLALSPAHGFPTDMSAFKAWAGRLAERGPWDFYPTGGEEYFVDYPPGYLFVLWVMGLLSRLVNNGSIPDIWVKLPPILADLGLAWVVGVGAARIAPAAVARRLPVRAIAAGAILLNPAIFFVSAVWGQADSVVTLLVAGGLVLIGTGAPTLRREAAGMALLACAFGTKPQAVFVIPVVLLVLCWRHIRVRMDETDDPEAHRREGRLGALRVGFLALVGVGAGFLMFAPFRLFPARAFEFYSEASRTYRVTSVFAFNLWGAVGFWRPDSGKDAVSFLGVPVVVWGIVAFVAIGALILGRAWSSLRHGVDQGRVLIFGSVALTLVGFAVVTRIHERYLFMPLALGAMLISHRFLQRAFIALSVLYLVNVWFPYVYYLEREGLHTPKLFGLYDALYGPDISGARMKAASLVITIACLAIAWLGWRALELPVGSDEAVAVPDDPSAGVPLPWSFELHGVGRRGALIALAVFSIALLSRIAGLGHPPGMYFDEVYHARTGAEYLAGKEVFEYTHPPLAKEAMGFSIQHLSGFKTRDGGPLPKNAAAETFVPRPNGVAWARSGDNGSAIQLGRVDEACDVRTVSTYGETDVRGDALVVTDDAAFLAGESEAGPVVVKIVGGREQWRATLPAPAFELVVVAREQAFLVTTAGELVVVSASGEPSTLALGARSLAAAENRAWATFPDDRQIVSWDTAGVRKDVIALEGTPGAIASPENVERVFVSVGDTVLSYDTEKTTSAPVRIEGAADLLGTVPETTSVWAVAGRAVRVIEPHSGVVIGRVAFERAPDDLSADVEHHQLIGIADDHIECARGRPQFAWRLGSAIAGSAMVALLFLIALRLFGHTLVALLSSLFLTVCGLAFTVSRIAMNDSYMTAFVLAAWFCVFSALRTSGRQSGDPPPRRGATIAWIAAGGVFAGLGLASKWPALYAIAGIGLLFLWDAADRKERSIWRIVGGFGPTIAVLVLLFGVVPLSIYAASYIPYFSLGHGASDFFDLQKSMFSYHSQLKATHPFGSPWYGWPFGFRAVFLYVSGSGTSRAEMWTIPNLVVLWGGLVAMGAALRDLRRTRQAALGVVLLAALVQYVPWMAVTRVTFMYHYLPVVPWLAIALAWFLVVGLGGWKYRKAAIVAVSVAAVAVFLFLYPILVGWDMPIRYLDLVRELFPWVI
jgi:dolichyl-phosphate-mannose--protein O-mannosyl transferase